MEYTRRKPRGVDLMRKLLELLADQEGVEIRYTIEQGGDVLTGTTARGIACDLHHNREGSEKAWR